MATFTIEDIVAAEGSFPDGNLNDDPDQIAALGFDAEATNAISIASMTMVPFIPGIALIFAVVKAKGVEFDLNANPVTLDDLIESMDNVEGKPQVDDPQQLIDRGFDEEVTHFLATAPADDEQGSSVIPGIVLGLAILKQKGVDIDNEVPAS